VVSGVAAYRHQQIQVLDVLVRVVGPGDPNRLAGTVELKNSGAFLRRPGILAKSASCSGLNPISSTASVVVGMSDAVRGNSPSIDSNRIEPRPQS
jgi:hypothetical protein